MQTNSAIPKYVISKRVVPPREAVTDRFLRDHEMYIKVKDCVSRKSLSTFSLKKKKKNRCIILKHEIFDARVTISKW